ncbi:MAG: hypothetical protein DCC58_20795 [Chloroflexi bacterium]|nr:MAG: hypothetical protein DCC58_20795 [Chloroflexota bacterium]
MRDTSSAALVGLYRPGIPLGTVKVLPRGGEAAVRQAYTVALRTPLPPRIMRHGIVTLRATPMRCCHADTCLDMWMK